MPRPMVRLLAAALLLATGCAPALAQAAGPEVVAEIRIHGNYRTPDDLVLKIAGIAVGTPLETRSIDVPTVFADFDDFWSPFLGGQGPAPGYATALSEGARAALRKRLRQSLPAAPDGRIALIARALAVRGRVPVS